jgi:arginase
MAEKDSPIRFEQTVAFACEHISTTVAKAVSDDLLLIVGGDHGLSLGSIHGIRSKNPETIVVWVDAHGDMNPPTASPTGNFHGMPLAFLLNQAGQHKAFNWVKSTLHPEKLILLGPRSLDPEEKRLIHELNITYHSTDEIHAQGMTTLVQKALKKIDPQGKCPIHLSFDVDACDPESMPSTGTLVSRGLDTKDLQELGQELAQTGRLRSMDLVEFNPFIGTSDDLKLSMQGVQDFLTHTLKSF